MPDYDVGQVYRASIDVTDLVTKAPANPTAAVLTVTWRNGTGPQTTVAALAPSGGQQQLPPPSPVGHVYYDWTFTEPALYSFSWVTIGPGGGTADYVNCRRYIAVCPLDDALGWLGVTNPAMVPKVRGLLGLATRLAEKIVGPTVPRRFVGEWVPGTVKPVLRVPNPPLPDEDSVESVESVYPGGPAWGPAEILVNPAAGTIRLASGQDWYYGPWKITYTGGRIEVSEAIVGGVQEILWDLWATQRWLGADSAMPELESVAAYEAQLPPGYELPKRAMEMLSVDQQPGFA